MDTFLKIVCSIVLLEIGLLLAWCLSSKMLLEIKGVAREIKILFKEKKNN